MNLNVFREINTISLPLCTYVEREYGSLNLLILYIYIYDHVDLHCNIHCIAQVSLKLPLMDLGGFILPFHAA